MKGISALLRPLILKLNKEFWKFNEICMRKSSANLDLKKNILNLKNRRFEPRRDTRRRFNNDTASHDVVWRRVSTERNYLAFLYLITNLFISFLNLFISLIELESVKRTHV